MSQIAKMGLGIIAATLVSTAAYSATVTPSNYDTIYTEGKRTATMDGTSLAGLTNVEAAVAGNEDVESFDMGNGGNDILLVGRVTSTGDDQYYGFGGNTTLDVNILNYGSSSRRGTNEFSAKFELFLGSIASTAVQTIMIAGTAPTIDMNVAFNSLALNGQTAFLKITSLSGASDYDVEISASVVPLPAGGLMLLTGLAGLGLARRKKKA